MNNDSSVPRHPIRVVAHRTGLTPATIRAWERRYDAVEPARSDGGQRLYSDRDIERLMTLRALTDMGRSISSVASLPPEAADALLSEDLEASPTGDPQGGSESGEDWVDDAYRHMTAMDTEGLERTLWRGLLALGARAFLDQVAAPLLSRVGAGWKAGRVSPAQEHMGSGVLERVLTWMTDPSKAAPGGPDIIIATLPGERHALGARLAAAAAQAEGWRTTYLGADLPLDEIASAARRVGAKTVAISAVQTDRSDETRSSLAALRGILDPDVTIMVGGAGAQVLKNERLPAGIEIFEDLGGFATDRRNGDGA